jgi:hypothetical protein
VNRSEALDGLQFDNDLGVNQEIHAITAFKLHVFVNYRRGLLPFKCDSAKYKLASQALFIGGFKQAGAEESVNLDRGTDDCVREVVVGHEIFLDVRFTTEDTE